MADKSTTPIKIPIIVVATIPIKMPPLTFLTTNKVVNTNPIKAKITPALLKFANAGTIPPFATKLVSASPETMLAFSTVKFNRLAFLIPT